MVLVDSSVWIESLRRNGNIGVKVAMEALLDADAAVICSPVRLEVLGAAKANERRIINEFISEVSYRPCTSSDWEHAIALAWRLRDKGIIVPWMDVMIATVAIEDGGRVYSLDKHFNAISSVTGLELYQPGYGGSYTVK
jgi:predicted nucleic acid-binding protein